MYFGAWIRQIKCILMMMTKEGSTKVVDLLTPVAGILVQGSCKGGGVTRGRGLKLCIILKKDYQYKAQ